MLWLGWLAGKRPAGPSVVWRQVLVQPQGNAGEGRDSEVKVGDPAPVEGRFGVLQAAWERSGRALRAALQAWQACVDRQRDVEAATAREAAARDRYLAAYLHPGGEVGDAP
jgi:hypothetical protein